MDTNPDACTQYIDRRSRILQTIAVHDKRIRRFFFADRCFGGISILASLFALVALASPQKWYAIMCMGVLVVSGVVQSVVDMPGRASHELDDKREMERQLRVADAAWDEWVRVWEQSGHTQDITLPDA